MRTREKGRAVAILRSKALLLVLMVGLAVASLTIYFVMTYVAKSPQEIDGGTAHAHAAFAFNVEDNRQLVGFADNVFVGRVMERVGSDSVKNVGPAVEGAPPTPTTQFSVEVLQNIKGKLNDTVNVSQTGGQVEYAATEDFPEEGIKKGQRVRQLVLLEEDPLLNPGEKILFVTRYDPAKDRHTIVGSLFGDSRIKDEQDRKEKVARFEEAEKNQIEPK